MNMIDKFRKSSAETLRKSFQPKEKTYENPFYYPILDSQKNASVVIRFLPNKNPDDVPYITRYLHFFKYTNKFNNISRDRWVNFLCPTTNGGDCPVCRANSELFTTGEESKQSIARIRKRKKEYICNVLVIKDPTSPEKEGKVFPFKFGATIFQKIKNALSPQFDEEPSINPFDMFEEGANFYLRINRDPSKGQITYENSKFTAPCALYDGNVDKIIKVVDQLTDIKEFLHEREMSTDEISGIVEKAYKDVLNVNNNVSESHNMSYNMNTTDDISSEPSPTTQKSTTDVPWEEPNETATSTDSDDQLAAFRAMIA